jgi:hypothetical protein
MRDDLFVLSQEQRRHARLAWRRVSVQQRRQVILLAKEGRPAPDPNISAAAREYGQYLLYRNRSNRLPRSLQPAVGTLVAVVGVLLWTGVVQIPGRLGSGAVLTVGGLLAFLLGLLSWSQRKCAHLLIGANAPGPPAPGP